MLTMSGPAAPNGARIPPVVSGLYQRTGTRTLYRMGRLISQPLTSLMSRTFSAPGHVQIEVDSIVFNSGASAYTITLQGSVSFPQFTISGVGIVNNSGITQNFATYRNYNGGRLVFFNGASAGNMTSFFNDLVALSDLVIPLPRAMRSLSTQAGILLGHPPALCSWRELYRRA